MSIIRNLLRNNYRLFRKALSTLPYRKNFGYCVGCESKTIFVEYGNWLRDQYRCIHCGCIPRNRALIRAMQIFSPDFRDMIIHESSPGNQVSVFLKRNCKNYSDSQYFPGIKQGVVHKGFRCENLHNLTFSDNTFDVFVTSDVFEHIMYPDKAFNEIARVLKPGGIHIFTMPWYPELKLSRRRAMEDERGNIDHIEEPIYHGNPVSRDGSLVTMDWGMDFCDRVYEFSRMTTTIYVEKDRYLGLDAKFNEVFISRKPE